MPIRKRPTGGASRVAEIPPAENQRTAVYPGSFDPITNGHIDIIRRALNVFPRITVAVAYNPNKDAAMFTPKERVEMIQQALADVGDRIIADSFTGLLVDYAERIGARVLIRGLRAVSDFEYEFQMTMMNRHLKPKIETVFMMAGEQYFYTSSRLVKEVATFGGDVRNLVPEFVMDRFAERLARKSGEKKRG
jgi:pantetheine-phosphate adenylyltransferase